MGAHKRDWSGSQALYDSLVALRVSHLAPTHPQTAIAIAQRGDNRFRLDDIAGARRDLLRARDILASSVGARHPYVATIEFQLGRLALREGDDAAAERFFASSDRTMASLFGAATAYRARPLLGLGEARLHGGDAHGAEEALHRALAIWRGGRAPSQVNIALATSLLGRVAARSGSLARAEALQREAYTLAVGRPSAPDSASAVIAADLALTLRARGRLVAADSFATSALTVLRRLPSEARRVQALAR